MRARMSISGFSIGFRVTSLTRSPLMYTSRSSRMESRYCWPVRIMGNSPHWDDCTAAPEGRRERCHDRAALGLYKLVKYYPLLPKYGTCAQGREGASRPQARKGRPVPRPEGPPVPCAARYHPLNEYPSVKP